ncbi:MAG: hypothetical protein RQ745_04350 [Longimicrobiales bacterium]|nr:hypothetical protein [Longimicrobiales bacterium]
MSRSFEVYRPASVEVAPQVHLERPRRAGLSPVLAVFTGFLLGGVFGVPLLGAGLGFVVWLRKRRAN